MKSFFKSATDTFLEVVGAYLLVLSTSTVLFSFIEGKTLFDSFWWACVTAMSVGYGDIVPVTIAGKILAMLLMHFVLLIIVPLIVTRLVTHVVDNKNEFTDSEQTQIKEDLKEIKELLEKK